MNEEELEEFRTLKLCYLHDFYGKWVFASCDGYVSCTDRYTTIRLKGIPWKGRNPVNLSFVLRMIRDELGKEYLTSHHIPCSKGCGRPAWNLFTGMCDVCFTILVDSKDLEVLDLLRKWEKVVFDRIDCGLIHLDSETPVQSRSEETKDTKDSVINHILRRLERLDHPERFRRSPYGRGKFDLPRCVLRRERTFCLTANLSFLR